MSSREQFEQFRDTRNALLESEGHKPGSKWHVTQSHYATWEASRIGLVEELRKLEWAPCVLQEAIDAAGVEPC